MSSRWARARLFLPLAASLLGLEAARAQCLSWDPLFSPLNGTNDYVAALAAYDDGGGAALYAGGAFASAGPVGASRVARWNGTAWSSVGSGVGGGSVAALLSSTVGGGSNLYAGGFFTTAGGPAALHVARWNGTTWSALGAGTDGYVLALTEYAGGGGPAVIVAGQFTTAGGPAASSIARWNGTTWSTLGTGIGGEVHALAVFDDGGTGAKLYAGGLFNLAGGFSVNRIASWNGTAWNAVGNGVNGIVNALAVFDDGTGPGLYVGGNFTIASGVNVSRIARWKASTWTAVGNGLDGVIDTLTVYDDGTGPALYAGGNFNNSGTTPMKRVARWDGTTWSALGTGVDAEVDALASFDAGSGAFLYAGGLFTKAGDMPAVNVAKWGACVPSRIATFCFGDGTGSPCPCANSGAAGHGCENSVTTGGSILSASGTTSPDTIVLAVTGELPSVLSIFLQGDTQVAPLVFGDGLRCAGGVLKRLYVKAASGGAVSAPLVGNPTITTQSATLGDTIAPGTTRYYQTYYRDPDPVFCADPPGNTWNVSNALSIAW